MNRRLGILLVCILVAGLLTATGCSFGPPVIGSSNIVTRQYDLSDFTRVEVAGGFEINVRQAASYRVSITANDNLFDYINADTRGNTLRIWLEPLHIYSNTVQKAEITLPALSFLNISGATRGKVERFDSLSDFELGMSGASTIILQHIEAAKVRFDISGASRISGAIAATGGIQVLVSGASHIDLEGSDSDLSLRASGASDINMEHFAVTNATVVFSGASNAVINASGRLDAELSGASELTYLDSPTLGQIDLFSGSRINRK